MIFCSANISFQLTATTKAAIRKPMWHYSWSRRYQAVIYYFRFGLEFGEICLNIFLFWIYCIPFLKKKTVITRTRNNDLLVHCKYIKVLAASLLFEVAFELFSLLSYRVFEPIVRSRNDARKSKPLKKRIARIHTIWMLGYKEGRNMRFDHYRQQEWGVW